MSTAVRYGTENLKNVYIFVISRLYNSVSSDSSVDMATRYGLNGPGIESRWGRDFPHPSRPL
jgi:hypothetical protein